MALSRKFLSALGIDADKVDEIIQAHTDTVNGLKDEIAKYKEDAEKLPGVQAELNKLKDAAKDGGDPYEVKYNAIKEEFDQYKHDVSERETKAKKKEAYRKLLKEAGISDKRIDVVLRVSDIDSIELDEDGNVKDRDNLINSIKADWSDFITVSSAQGAVTPTPPKGAGKSYASKEEIFAIKDAGERQKAIAANLELFNS